MKNFSKNFFLMCVLIFHANTYGRNPFSYATNLEKGTSAHGTLHDLHVEFDVYTDDQNSIHVKKVENKSPST